MGHFDIPYIDVAPTHTYSGGNASYFDDELDFESLEVDLYYSGFLSGHPATSQTVIPPATNGSSGSRNRLSDSSAGPYDSSDPMGMMNYLQSPKIEDNSAIPMASSSPVQLEQHSKHAQAVVTTSNQVSDILAGVQTHSAEYPPTPVDPTSSFEMPVPPQVPVYSWSATDSPRFEPLLISSHAPISTSTASTSRKAYYDLQSEAWIYADVAPVPSSSQAILQSISSGSDILIQTQKELDTDEYLAPLVEQTYEKAMQALVSDWSNMADLPNFELPSFSSSAPMSMSTASQSIYHDPESHIELAPSSSQRFPQSYALPAQPSTRTFPQSSATASVSTLPAAHAPQKRKRAVEETQSQEPEKRQRRQVPSNAPVNTSSCSQPPTLAPQAHHIPSSSQPSPLPYLIPSHPSVSTLPQPAAPPPDRPPQKRKNVVEDTPSQGLMKRRRREVSSSLASASASVSVSGANTSSYPQSPPAAALQPLDHHTERRKGKRKLSLEEGPSEAPEKRQRHQTASSSSRQPLNEGLAMPAPPHVASMDGGGSSTGGEPTRRGKDGSSSAALSVAWTSTRGSTSAAVASASKQQGTKEPECQQRIYYCNYINPVTGKACVGEDGMPRSYVERRNFRRHYKSKHGRQEDKDVKNGILEREKAVALNTPWCSETVYTCRVSGCRYPAEHGGRRWEMSTYNRTEKDIAKHKRTYHPQPQ